jgi:hypothetical protein
MPSSLSRLSALRGADWMMVWNDDVWLSMAREFIANVFVFLSVCDLLVLDTVKEPKSDGKRRVINALKAGTHDSTIAI